MDCWHNSQSQRLISCPFVRCADPLLCRPLLWPCLQERARRHANPEQLDLHNTALLIVCYQWLLLCLLTCLQVEAAAVGLGDPEQLDLRQEAKINSLELAVKFNERAALLSARAAMPAHTCPGGTCGAVSTARLYVLCVGEGGGAGNGCGVIHAALAAVYHRIGMSKGTTCPGGIYFRAAFTTRLCIVCVGLSAIGCAA
jgi:hypothetical protein